MERSWKMTDREKVIKAIELEIKHENTWECRKECPYYGKTDRNCFTQVLVDALELLKEHEPVKPFLYHDIYWCGKCGNRVSQRERIMNSHSFLVYRYKYCQDCGRKVKWNDSDRNGNG